GSGSSSALRLPSPAVPIPYFASASRTQRGTSRRRSCQRSSRCAGEASMAGRKRHVACVPDMPEPRKRAAGSRRLSCRVAELRIGLGCVGVDAVGYELLPIAQKLDLLRSCEV